MSSLYGFIKPSKNSHKESGYRLGFFVCLFLIKPSYEHFRITCVVVAPDDQLQRLWDYSHLKSEQTVILI